MRLTYKLEKPIDTKYLHYVYMAIGDYDISRGNYGRIADWEIYNKLGQYEDIDTDPTHLAKIKQALEIIKRQPFAFASLKMFLKDFDTYEKWEKINPNCFTKEEYDLLKEVLEK